MDQKTTLVIPANNESPRLGATLKHLLRFELPIIVVDNASTDATGAIAKRAGVRVVHEPQRGIAFARNAGARAARTQKILFIDADTRPSRDLVLRMIRQLDSSVSVSCQSRFDSYPTLASRGILLYRGMARLRGWGVGHCLGVQRTAFRRIGGFDTTLRAYEELDLIHRLKRVGAHTLLSDRVVTSSRKFSSPSDRLGFILGLFYCFLFNRFDVGRERTETGFWYGGRGVHNYFLIILLIFLLGGILNPTLIPGWVGATIAFSIATLYLFWGSFTPRIVLIGVLALGIELIGAQTGLIFGSYSYPIALPVFVGLSWMTLSAAAVSRFRTPLVAALFLVFFDLGLEGYAVATGLWQWEALTIHNYLGWFVVAFFLCTLLGSYRISVVRARWFLTTLCIFMGISCLTLGLPYHALVFLGGIILVK